MRFTLFGGSADAAQKARAAAYERPTVTGVATGVAKALVSTTEDVASAADQAGRKIGSSAKGALESALKAASGRPDAPMAGSDRAPYYGTCSTS